MGRSSYVLKRAKVGSALLITAFLCGAAPFSSANPTGGQVAAGSANITNAPGIVTITQSTGSAVINWQDFSIAAGEATKFQVPSSTSSTLNRVTGGNISNIYGSLQSNGRLFLINPNGIFVGPTGRIDTNGFLASTLNLSDAQYLQGGDLNFTGTSRAGVTNQGKISAKTGDVYLIAAQVNNSGSISAKHGNVGLAAGTNVLLQKAGDQHLFVQVGDGSSAKLATGVVNSGKIAAASAELKAAGGNAYALAINNSGNIAATGIKKINGQVFLMADGADITNSGQITARQANGNGGKIVVSSHSQVAKTKGTTLNYGTISATGANPGTSGGLVEVLGDRVGLMSGSLVDVSGANGGGAALIGGDQHGANAAVANADQTYLDQNASIKADALTNGDGGRVILWGNSTTQAYGHISARGGENGGNGGFVETSGASLQAYSAPDLAAPKGKGGTWLLDPSDVLIDDSVSDSGFSLSPAFTITSGSATINQATILTALQSGGFVDIDASQGTGGGGTIVWTQTGGTPFDGSSLTSLSFLSLFAPTSIGLNGVTITNGSNLDLTLIGGSGTIANSNFGSLSALAMNGSSLTISNSTFSNIGSLTMDSYVSGGAINVTNSNISMLSGLSNLFYLLGQGNPVSVTGSTITFPVGSQTNGFILGQGTPVSITSSTLNSAGSGFFDIEGQLNTLVQSAGVTISNSTINAASGSNIIQGTGLLAAGFESTGVEIDNSNITIGIAGSPGPGNLHITGFSDPGSTSLSPNSTFADNSIGVNIKNSTFQSYTNDEIDIHGISFAANNTSANGVSIINSHLTSTVSAAGMQGSVVVEGEVKPEAFSSGFLGEANVVIGLEAAQSTFTGSGGRAGVTLEGYTDSTTATDNGNLTTPLLNVGVDFSLGTTVSSSSSSGLKDTAGIIYINGISGPVIASNSNPNQTISAGLLIRSQNISISSNGGIILVGGIAGDVTGFFAESVGTFLGDGSGQPVNLTATNGGVIALGGVGGGVTAINGGSSYDAGLQLNNATVSADTGVVGVFGLAGINKGGGSIDSAGVDMISSHISTNTTGPGLNLSYGGLSANIPPGVLLYGSNGGVDFNTQLFVPGSGGYAVREDANSSIVTGNLIMGNVYSIISGLVPAANLNQLITNLQTQLGVSNLNTFISQFNVTVNPIGQISLPSTGNLVTNLDSVLVGSGGLTFYDSTDLTIDPIGGNNNSNFGDINVAATGPINITTTGNLILSDVSPITGVASSLPVIWTSGSGNDIVLNVENGFFINQGGASGLQADNGAFYAINVRSPQYAILGGLNPSIFFNSTYTGGGLTSNSIFFQSSQGNNQVFQNGSGQSIDPFVPVSDALYSIAPIDEPLNISSADVIGGAGGVAPVNTPAQDIALSQRLTQLYGAARAPRLLSIIQNDTKDGSTVNTGSLTDKWAADTGMSKIVRTYQSASVFDGLAHPYRADDLIFNQFQLQSTPQELDELSRAAYGTRTVRRGAGH